MHPIRAEARELPFAHGYFDAVISIGAYHYYGPDADMLEADQGELLGLVRVLAHRR